ncbi:hypothetical protein A4A49_10551 [Nicotiana attenuata]|uniref:Uncharacterized protein n=1 Tax=Nicotiana attenuata TaxID=49451 RepID=A0A314LB34_NICAT|nr:hypothetical protein A4A49_10551 [Nicotiana attenuata]
MKDISMASLVLCFYLKKKKKSKTTMVEEKEVKHIDAHLRVEEAIVEGPHGRPETVVLSMEEDLHVDDDIIRKKKELEAQNLHAKSSETIPSALEVGQSSSSSGYGHS